MHEVPKETAAGFASYIKWVGANVLVGSRVPELVAQCWRARTVSNTVVLVILKTKQIK
jgi:hypothetical protein